MEQKLYLIIIATMFFFEIVRSKVVAIVSTCKVKDAFDNRNSLENFGL